MKLQPSLITPIKLGSTQINTLKTQGTQITAAGQQDMLIASYYRREQEAQPHGVGGRL